MTGKEKAIEILKQLDIYEPYIEGFKQKDKVCFFEEFAGFWIDQEPEAYKKMQEIERHGEEEIVRERTHRNACEIEIENPYRNPHCDNPPVLAEKRRILRHRFFQRLICHSRNAFENGKRQGVLVVLRVVRRIDRPYCNSEKQNARQNDCNHFAETARDNARMSAPFPEIFAVEKQGEKRLCRGDETAEIANLRNAVPLR